MKPHIKNYLKYFNLGEQDTIRCENCGKEGRIDRGGFDLHHIVYRSHGGSDDVNNICCLCRKCHDAAHGLAKTFLHPTMLQVKHHQYLLDYDHR